MKNLTSDTLFYRSFIGLIVAPLFLIFFAQLFFVGSFPNSVINIFYVVMTIFVIFQWVKILKYKKVSYHDDRLRIESYFTKKYFDVPFSDLIRIKKAFSVANKVARMSYKVTFNREDKICSIFFFKSLQLYNVEDMDYYIGMKNKIE